MKKRYNKIMAFLLSDAVLCLIMCPIYVIKGMFDEELSDFVYTWITMIVISIIILFFVTRHIIKRTPEGERVGTWLRCLWLGVKINFKISLCLLIIFIPMMLSKRLSVPEQDVYNPYDWYNEKENVYDNDGNEYKVLRSGEWVEDKSGKRYRVVKGNSGAPFLVSGNDRKELHM